MGGTVKQCPFQIPLFGVQLPATGGGGVCGFGFALACAVLDSASAINAAINKLAFIRLCLRFVFNQKFLNRLPNNRGHVGIKLDR
jgi:hypothetical protein